MAVASEDTGSDQADVRELVRASRAACGLPETVVDCAVLDHVRGILRNARQRPASGV